MSAWGRNMMPVLLRYVPSSQIVRLPGFRLASRPVWSHRCFGLGRLDVKEECGVGLDHVGPDANCGRRSNRAASPASKRASRTSAASEPLSLSRYRIADGPVPAGQYERFIPESAEVAQLGQIVDPGVVVAG